MDFDYLHHDYDIEPEHQYKLILDGKISMSVYGNLFDVLWLKFYEYTSLKKHRQVTISETDLKGVECVIVNWTT